MGKQAFLAPFDLAHHQNQELTPQGQRVESGGGHQNGLVLPPQSVLLQFLKPQKLTPIICHTFSPTFAMFHSGFLTYVATLFFFFWELGQCLTTPTFKIINSCYKQWNMRGEREAEFIQGV
jgi:hypothetical protein